MSVTPYQQLEKRFARLFALHGAIAILDWDTQAIMPTGAARARAEQMAQLRLIEHELLTDPAVGGWLDAAEAGRDELNDWQSANLREMRRMHIHTTAVPPDLVAASSRATSACDMAWRDARPNSDFEGLKPHLAEVLRLERERADAKAAVLGCDPYDALMDQFEPGNRASIIDALFDEIARFLPAFLEQVLERQRSCPLPQRLGSRFPVEQQRALGLRLMGCAGFDFTRGRLDVSTHPFCGGVPDDVRITTRYDDADFVSAIMGVLHETGHALYELGLPAEWRGQPVGLARGMAVHESQSLLIEMQASRSPEFIGFLAPVAAEQFGGDGPAWSVDNFRRIYHRVEPGLIRVDADEVTYPAHVILRYRLEKAMIAGDLALDDLPGAWADGMQSLLGLTVPDHRRGCLQDIHWPVGAWGYYPTYTQGAIIAAQLFEAATAEVAEIKPGLAKGNFGPLLAWLRQNVHRRGCLTDTDTLISEATGRPLDITCFKAHLAKRYLDA